MNLHFTLKLLLQLAHKYSKEKFMAFQRVPKCEVPLRYLGASLTSPLKNQQYRLNDDRPQSIRGTY
jgi:hypothetical protein